MKKALLVFLLVGAIASVSIGGAGGCGSTSTGSVDNTDDDGGGGAGSSSEASWSASGDALTIDDIVNDSGSEPSLDLFEKKAVTASSSAPFYFGRFLLSDGFDLFTGSIKFKLNKRNSVSAFFSNVTLEHYSMVVIGADDTDIVTSSTDLAVSDSFDASTNHVEIDNAATRFIGFDLDFGNNEFFGDITNAGVVFSSDFTTMAGGNNESFFFIAQKVSSQPDVSESAILGDFNIFNFTVSSSGEVTDEGTSTVTVGGTGPNGFTAFIGTNSDSGDFNGELFLTDATSGAFLFGYGDEGIDGAFLLSGDESLAVGIDIGSGDAVYFAAER